ncbi:MAG TPA: DoxX family protein [Acetobacteraceae bacterium]|jgi:putative oxidoreductase|nr:DoxX family protein [Acetobacteraceae bacterium]
MARIEARLNRLQPYALALLRIVVALLILEHGLSKLIGFPGAMPKGFHIASLLGLASIIETVGGLLLLVGFRTRLVAFILSGEVAAAYFIAHAPRGFYPILNGGEAAILFCFIFLYLACAGGGACSVDRR